MGLVAIPRAYLGHTLDEAKIKKALLDLCPNLHFDMGACLGLWHPIQSERQGVFHLGRHIVSMDRGSSIPEVPIWSTRRVMVRVPTQFLSWGELSDPFTQREFIREIDGTERETGYSAVRREERDRILWVGWRHTLAGILKANLPGITQIELEKKLGVDLTFKLVDPVDVIESAVDKVLNRQVAVGMA